MKKYWIFTSEFPFGKGEQFLETEVKYWSEALLGEVVLFPSSIQGKKRSLPAGIKINNSLEKNKGNLLNKKTLARFRAVFSIFFLKEIFFLAKSKKLTFENFQTALKHINIIYFYKIRINRIIEKESKKEIDNIFFYSYWFDNIAYALLILKKEGKIKNIVTRAHGYDLYEERRKNSYMPYKRQFIDFERIFTVSKAGLLYLHENYGIPFRKIKVSRLGVELSNKLCLPSENYNFHILSISFCVQIKRIDKIINAIYLASKNLSKSKVLIKWTHIGDGQLKKVLEREAEIKFLECPNVKFQFLGKVSNNEVYEFYRNNKIDVFINTSESEGIPVSIMEAMSFGVPVIAPAVGGIPEIVNFENGHLLNKNPSIEEICKSLLRIDHFKNFNLRQKARKLIIKKYNARKNYLKFIDILKKLK